MAFDSVEYILFFLAFYVIYAAAGSDRRRKMVLLAGSYFFYASFVAAYVVLLFGSTLLSYYAAGVLQREQRTSRRLAVLIGTIGCFLALLAFFKYGSFAADAISGFLGRRRAVHAGGLSLPIGISFFTFNIIGYLVECHRGRMGRDQSLFEHALYVAFFPYLLAGPIVRATDFLPQLRGEVRIRSELIWEGMVLLTFGYVKKMAFADNLAVFVNSVFADPAARSGPELLCGAYAYAFQIYCDFSGYTDIARGTGALLGYRLPINFNFPYLAKNPGDFWGRWHISLSSWFRDYLYIPLGGNRQGSLKTAGNLLLVMALCGLWHGANWTFVLWGAYHGVLLILHRYGEVLAGRIRPARSARPALTPSAAAALRAGSVLVMFHLTTFGWILFRAPSVTQFGRYVRQMLSGVNPAAFLPGIAAVDRLALFSVVLLALYHFAGARLDLKGALLGRRYSPSAITVLLCMALGAAALRVDQAVTFIYFQF